MMNIVLIGFMGTGKTTAGRRLALRLGRPFFDTDAEVERVTGKAVRQIFDTLGGIRFRSEEALVIKRLSGGSGAVIATGGGAVLKPENLALLKSSGIIVLLTASPEVIYRRVRNKKTRPLLNQGGDLMNIIMSTLAQREAKYSEAADITISTDRGTPEETVSLIIDQLRERNII